jgi:hypothetical protein
MKKRGYYICPFCLEPVQKGDKGPLENEWVHDYATSPADDNMHGPMVEAALGHPYPCSEDPRNRIKDWLPWEV